MRSSTQEQKRKETTQALASQHKILISLDREFDDKSLLAALADLVSYTLISYGKKKIQHTKDGTMASEYQYFSDFVKRTAKRSQVITGSETTSIEEKNIGRFNDMSKIQKIAAAVADSTIIIITGAPIELFELWQHGKNQGVNVFENKMCLYSGSINVKDLEAYVQEHHSKDDAVKLVQEFMMSFTNNCYLFESFPMIGDGLEKNINRTNYPNLKNALENQPEWKGELERVDANNIRVAGDQTKRIITKFALLARENKAAFQKFMHGFYERGFTSNKEHKADTASAKTFSQSLEAGLAKDIEADDLEALKKLEPELIQALNDLATLLLEGNLNNNPDLLDEFADYFLKDQELTNYIDKISKKYYDENGKSNSSRDLKRIVNITHNCLYETSRPIMCDQRIYTLLTALLNNDNSSDLLQCFQPAKFSKKDKKGNNQYIQSDNSTLYYGKREWHPKQNGTEERDAEILANIVMQDDKCLAGALSTRGAKVKKPRVSEVGVFANKTTSASTASSMDIGPMIDTTPAASVNAPK